MQLKLYQVDAFTERTFGGNPAAVVPLEDWLPDATMQAIALENNLSETAFFVPRDRENPDGGFDLRWFTPLIEADLCGHATLGTAWVLFNRLGHASETITFHTRSGPLTVTRDGDRLAMDFPAQPPAPIGSAAGIGDVAGAIGVRPEAVLAAPYALAVLDSEEAVRAVRPDFRRVAALDIPELIITAPGAEGGDCDFVSRFFAPTGGIDEDPVTGSAHCILIPYWAERLGKTEMFARQVSARGGALWCALRGDRVSIAGYAAPYLEGTIAV
ncbi:MAG: PhzF family phenazine biosynthesis protein [Rhodospirillaceae bacterium]|nr:PhzF family phenazine biosynthesis protein [Rhodospirillaceae bacterium]